MRELDVIDGNDGEPLVKETYLKVSTVAAELGFKIPTIYGWINGGKLNAVRVAGRAVRITRTELNRFKKDQIKDY